MFQPLATGHNRGALLKKRACSFIKPALLQCTIYPAISLYLYFSVKEPLDKSTGVAAEKKGEKEQNRWREIGLKQQQREKD